MKLINSTTIPTRGLRAMLYYYARQAGISTRGIIVEIRRARVTIHGLCFPGEQKIQIWLFPQSKSQDIAHLWVHELTHLTPRNRNLYANGHRLKGQRHADTVALRVTGQAHADVEWRPSAWQKLGRWWKWPTKARAQTILKQFKSMRPGIGQNSEPVATFSYRLAGHQGCWWIERKERKLA